MKDRINGIRKEARASWWEDGITEIVAGLGVLVIGSVGISGYALEGRVPPWSYAVFILLMVALAFGIRWVVLWAKERWVWPHTGYSVVKGRGGKYLIPFYLIVFALLALAFLFPSYTPIVGGTVGAVILVSLALYNGLRRFYALALLSFVLGILLYSVGIRDDRATFLILIGVGSVMFFLGVLRFARFKREVSSAHEG